MACYIEKGGGIGTNKKGYLKVALIFIHIKKCGLSRLWLLAMFVASFNDERKANQCQEASRKHSDGNGH